MVGPAEVLPGSVSEFVATVRNTGSVASGPTTLEFSWDDAFTPLEASEGYKLASSRVSWSLTSIEPGGELRRQINLRSQSTGAAGTAARSCVRGVLSGSVGGVMVADESCVLIRSNTPRARTPRDAGLRLTLADCDDPVIVGHPTTLICTVVNNGTMSTGRIDLTVVAIRARPACESMVRTSRSTRFQASLPVGSRRWNWPIGSRAAAPRRQRRSSPVPNLKARSIRAARRPSWRRRSPSGCVERPEPDHTSRSFSLRLTGALSPWQDAAEFVQSVGSRWRLPTVSWRRPPITRWGSSCR